MKSNPLPQLVVLLAMMTTTPLLAAEPAAPTWHAQTLAQAITNMLIFVGVGIMAAVAGYKVFDKCTPGDLTKEIVEHKNIAAAIVAGAVILGVCIIIAAAMIG